MINMLGIQIFLTGLLFFCTALLLEKEKHHLFDCVGGVMYCCSILIMFVGILIMIWVDL